MRFIPTSTEKVEALKKQAKRMHRAGRGKHTELLDRVARGAGYEHWHHVLICLRESTSVHEARGLLRELDAICDAAVSGQPKVVITGPEASTTQPFLLFATEDGDAWMLDPEEDQFLCLAWKGERQRVKVRDLPTHIEIEWDGTFELAGAFFSVTSDHRQIGSRYIAGYPIDQVRRLLEDVRSADRRMRGIFGPADAVLLGPEIVRQLLSQGWDEARLQAAARYGAMYSPSRDSLLFPPVSGSSQPRG